MALRVKHAKRETLEPGLKMKIGTTIIIAMLLVGCKHSPQQASIKTAEVAKIAAIEWEINATEWPLGEERVCVFLADVNSAGCWESYDSLKGDFYNRGDHPNDHTYLMRANLPENVKQALAEGHNQRAYCARDEYMHLSCPRDFPLKK